MAFSIAEALDEERKRLAAKPKKEETEQRETRRAGSEWHSNIRRCWYEAHLLTDDELPWPAAVTAAATGKRSAEDARKLAKAQPAPETATKEASCRCADPNGAEGPAVLPDRQRGAMSTPSAHNLGRHRKSPSARSQMRADRHRLAGPHCRADRRNERCAALTVANNEKTEKRPSSKDRQTPSRRSQAVIEGMRAARLEVFGQ